MDNNNSITPKVSLGCGTLIIIAVIVLVFSNAGNEDEKFRKLNQKLNSMESSLKNMESTLSNMKRQLETSE